MEKFCIGKAVKLHGYLGEFKISTQFDNDFDIKKITKIYDETDNEYSIKRIFKTSDGIVVSLEGVGLENAKLMINTLFFIDRSLVFDKILFEDLKLSKVFFEDKTLIGKVTDVADYGSAEVITFLTNRGKEVMFPNVSGIIISFDYKTKTLIINKQKLLEVSDYEDWCINAFSWKF